jgi:NAD(P)-dependent dehydrogenase (short-subunit alcohol dehydrogenase family)
LKHLAQRTAVITGAASGIGLGLARACARAGMNVALLDIRADLLRQVCTQLEAQGAAVFGVSADVSSAAALEAAAQAVQERFGKVHLLANNAGVAVHGSRSPKSRWRIGTGHWA